MVWIYSIINDTLIKNESPGLFKNLFPNKEYIKTVISSHYSPKTKRFYFFEGMLSKKKETNYILTLFKKSFSIFFKTTFILNMKTR